MTNRLLAAIQSLIQQALAPTIYLGIYRYTVTEVVGQTISGRPRGTALPYITRVDMGPGIPGTYLTPEVGGIVRVMFEDGDPTLPIVVSYDRTESVVKFNNGNSPVSRVGDHSAAGTLLFAGAANVLTITYTSPDSVPTEITVGIPGVTGGGTITLTGKLTEGAADIRA